METKKTLYQKLQQARESIKKMKITKGGHNTYSNYDYFTPEQIGTAVYDACKEASLLTKFDLKRNEQGYFGELTIVDLDTKEVATFTMATDIPTITATNITQQIGGAMTYTERYLKMSAFDIQDNSLDFDDDKSKPAKPVAKPAEVKTVDDTHTCPKCGKPMNFSKNTNDWYCYDCWMSAKKAKEQVKAKEPEHKATRPEINTKEPSEGPDEREINIESIPF